MEEAEARDERREMQERILGFGRRKVSEEGREAGAAARKESIGFCFVFCSLLTRAPLHLDFTFWIRRSSVEGTHSLISFITHPFKWSPCYALLFYIFCSF